MPYIKTYFVKSVFSKDGGLKYEKHISSIFNVEKFN